MSDSLVAASRASIEQGSKSFALASRLFDPVLRGRATLLYAWCRYADDLIDGQVGGQGRVESAAAPAERLAQLDADTRAALAGRADAMPYAALAQVAAETGMPDRYPLDLIEGFRIDVEQRRFVTEDDLLTYCYHVAGCVGVMMAVAMGVDAADRTTLERASDLGLAFQLNNIARDVIEDAGIDRCYLPEDWLAEAGLTRATFALPENRMALATVVRRLVDTAERYETSSRFGTPALPWRAAWAVLAAADIYGGIGRRVRALGPAALNRRVTTSKSAKYAAVARALPQALSRSRRWPVPGPSRAGLWTMP